jgi:hypothetical protein
MSAGPRRADIVKAEAAATSREFTHIVLAEQPPARRNRDLFMEVTR